MIKISDFKRQMKYKERIKEIFDEIEKLVINYEDTEGPMVLNREGFKKLKNKSLRGKNDNI